MYGRVRLKSSIAQRRVGADWIVKQTETPPRRILSRTFETQHNTHDKRRTSLSLTKINNLKPTINNQQPVQRKKPKANSIMKFAATLLASAFAVASLTSGNVAPPAFASSNDNNVAPVAAPATPAFASSSSSSSGSSWNDNVAQPALASSNVAPVASVVNRRMLRTRPSGGAPRRVAAQTHTMCPSGCE